MLKPLPLPYPNRINSIPKYQPETPYTILTYAASAIFGASTSKAEENYLSTIPREMPSSVLDKTNRINCMRKAVAANESIFVWKTPQTHIGTTCRWFCSNCTEKSKNDDSKAAAGCFLAVYIHNRRRDRQPYLYNQQSESKMIKNILHNTSK